MKHFVEYFRKNACVDFWQNDDIRAYKNKIIIHFLRIKTKINIRKTQEMFDSKYLHVQQYNWAFEMCRNTNKKKHHAIENIKISLKISFEIRMVFDFQKVRSRQLTIVMSWKTQTGITIFAIFQNLIAWQNWNSFSISIA